MSVALEIASSLSCPQRNLGPCSRIVAALEHYDQGLILRQVRNQPPLKSREASLNENQAFTGDHIPPKGLSGSESSLLSSNSIFSGRLRMDLTGGLFY